MAHRFGSGATGQPCLRRASITALPLFLLASLVLTSCGAARPTPRPTLIPPTPTPVVKRAVDVVAEIKTICLDTKISFDRGTPADFANDRELIQRALTGLGLTVMPAGACDATLTVDAVLTPLSANYATGSSGSKTCFSGASLAGTMTLAKPGYEPAQVPIGDSIAPPSGVISYCATATGAPFDGVWVKAILKGLNRIWGSSAVVQAAQDKGTHHPGGCNPEAITYGTEILVADRKANEIARALSYMVNDGAKYYCWRNVLNAMQRAAGSISREEKNAAVQALTTAFATRSKDVSDADLLCQTLASVTGASITKQGLACSAPADAAKWLDWWNGVK